MEFIDAPFGGGVVVGVHEGEVDESLEGAPVAAGGALLHLDRSDGALGAIVRKRYVEIDREAQDHVFVVGESSDQPPCPRAASPVGSAVVHATI